MLRNEDFRSPARLDTTDVRSQPRSSRLWSAAATAALNANKPAEALTRARTALEIFPRNPEAWRIAGIALFTAGQRDAALEALQNSLQYGGGHNEQLHVVMAQLLKAQGDYRAAIAVLEAHVTQNPNAAAARNNLAWYLLTAEPPELRDPARACRYAAAAVEHSPTAADFLDTYLSALVASDCAAEVPNVLDRQLPRLPGPERLEIERKWKNAQ